MNTTLESFTNRMIVIHNEKKKELEQTDLNYLNNLVTDYINSINSSILTSLQEYYNSADDEQLTLDISFEIMYGNQNIDQKLINERDKLEEQRYSYLYDYVTDRIEIYLNKKLIQEIKFHYGYDTDFNVLMLVNDVVYLTPI